MSRQSTISGKGRTVARDPWSPPIRGWGGHFLWIGTSSTLIHGSLQTLVDIVIRLMEKIPWV